MQISNAKRNMAQFMISHVSLFIVSGSPVLRTTRTSGAARRVCSDAIPSPSQSHRKDNCEMANAESVKPPQTEKRKSKNERSEAKGERTMAGRRWQCEGDGARAARANCFAVEHNERINKNDIRTHIFCRSCCFGL